MASVWRSPSWIKSHTTEEQKTIPRQEIYIISRSKSRKTTKEGKPDDKRCKKLVGLVATVAILLSALLAAILILVLDRPEKPNLVITAVAEITSLYVDGETVSLKSNSKSLYEADKYVFDTVPSCIAVCINSSRYLAPALLAEVGENNKIISSTNAKDWRCTPGPVSGLAWMTLGFDDSMWDQPIVFATNGDFKGASDTYVSGVSDDAEWITAGSVIGQMYCRYKAEIIMEDDIPTRENTLNDDITAKSTLLEQQLEAFLAATDPGQQVPLLTLHHLLEQHLLADELIVPSVIQPTANQQALQRVRRTVQKALEALRNLKIRPLQPDESFPLPSLTDGTCFWPMYDCPNHSKYRSYDGSCNNLNYPLWGRSFTPLERLLAPEYQDQMGGFKTSNDGQPLPGVREVCSDLSLDHSRPHSIDTMAVMGFGQFLDHDLDLSPVSNLAFKPRDYSRKTDISCGSSGCEHDHEDCYPILIPKGDPDFHNKTCLKFVRSKPIPDLQCSGVREQLNKVTSFLDASQVYGSTREEALSLRDTTDASRGRLRMQVHPRDKSRKPLLPTTNKDVNCVDNNRTYQCFKSGDERTNEHHILTVFHTIFIREHNRLEDKLHLLNPSWSGERLYQEVRRIVYAQLQHITYTELLPVIFGQEYVWTDEASYSPEINPSIVNSFGAAAFRFGHSLLSDTIQRLHKGYIRKPDSDLQLSQQFFRPQEIYNVERGGLDAFMRGIANQTVEKCDRFVTIQVTKSLFTDKPPNGEGNDLFSLNLQRGRDHGIPPYNAWRKYCGLRPARNFNDFVDIPDQAVRDILKKHYAHVDHVDLYPAAVSEWPLKGGLVGPTFACIIAEQFRRTRDGDRFWYTNPTIKHDALLEGQIAELKHSSLAKIVCTNSDGIETIQPNIMLLPFRQAYPTNDYDDYDSDDHGLTREEFSRKWTENYNARIPCSDIPSINLNWWQGF